MNLKKRVAQGGVVAVSMAILVAVTSVSSSTPVTMTAGIQENKVVEDTVKNEVATIEKKDVYVVTATEEASEDSNVNDNQAEQSNTVSVSVGVGADMVSVVAAQFEEKAASQNVESEEKADKASEKSKKEDTDKSKSTSEEEVKESSVWDKRLMANVEESLNVRSAADENSELVGKIYKGAIAEVVEKGDAWTHIVSGNVDGYVKNDYCVYGQDAEKLANSVCKTYATTTTDGVRVRREPNTDSEILATEENGTKLTVDTSAEAVDGWIAIVCGDVTGYTSAEYLTVELDLKLAVTIEEEEARIRAEEEAKAAAAKAAAEKAAAEQAAAAKQKAAASASTDEVTLLAAVIQCEAGGESYAGKVAVGSVVMNRVRSGAYPSSITGVIYQSGQFSTVGSLSGTISRGVSASCVQAAQEAIAGADSTGGATSFRRVSSGIGGVVIGNHVFF